MEPEDLLPRLQKPTTGPCTGPILSLCFNWAPRHEVVLGKWRYISTHSWHMEVSDQFTPRPI
jgi:hypothetical protein